MRFELEEDGFVRIPRTTEPSAVYALVCKGKVVYIGKSKSVFHRISAHHASMTRKRKSAVPVIWATEGEAAKYKIVFDEVLVLFCPERDLERLEIEYIDRFRPEFNIQIREPIPDLGIDIHALVAKLEWKTPKDAVKDEIPRRKL